MRLSSLRTTMLLLVSLVACTRQDATASATAATPVAPANAAPSLKTPGIDCGQASTAVEKAICTDPVLVGLDAELAAAWTQALARSDDRDALRADQRTWLRQRTECIALANQRACLRARYATRTAVLRAVQGGAFTWAGKWTRIDDRASFELGPVAGSGDFTFKLDAAAGAHDGGVEDARATPAGPRTLRVTAAGTGTRDCRLELRRLANQIELVEVDSAFDCGAPEGVVFTGRYVPRHDAITGIEPSLLTLDLAQDAAADARIRQLLGRDGYDALVDRCDMIAQDEQTPGLVTCGVRGLYTLMEAALQQQGEVVRVAQIVDGEVRWWSNDPATQSAPPPWFDAWRARFADTPVRLMSMPGTPLLQDARGG